LKELPVQVEEAELGSPAVIVIGDVVSLREQLAWWEHKPLFGKRVLVTRTLEQAGEMARALRAVGAEPVLLPMIELKPAEDTEALDEALRNLEVYDGLLFTSANAVRFFVERARALGVEAAFQNLNAWVLCVGPQSARAAHEAGLAVHLTGSGRGDSEAFLRELVEALPPSGRRFLLPRSDIGRDVVPDGLRAAGAEVDAVEAYRNVPAAVDAAELNRSLREGELDMLTFASPSAFLNLLALLEPGTRAGLSDIVLAAVGRTTAQAMETEGFTPQVVPDRPSGQGLIAALVEYAENASAR